MKSMRSHIARFLSATAVVSVALVAAIALAAWAGPTAVPPNNNTATPIDVGGGQVKAGDLAVSILMANQLCFGTSCVSSWDEATAPACGVGVPVARSYGTNYVAATDGFVVYDAACTLHTTGTVTNTGGVNMTHQERFSSGGGQGSMTLPVRVGATWRATLNNGCGGTVFWIPLSC